MNKKLKDYHSDPEAGGTTYLLYAQMEAFKKKVAKALAKKVAKALAKKKAKRK